MKDCDIDYDVNYYGIKNKKKCKYNGCGNLIIAILTVLALFIVGIIIGATYSMLVLGNVSVFYAMLMLILFIVIIYKACIFFRKY